MSRSPGRLVYTTGIVIAAAIIGSLAYSYFANRLTPVQKKTLRIGFEPNPPFQVRTEAGLSGLAVDVVNEAAQRAAITLKWIETGTSSEEAFRRGLVDLWPLMANLPERRGLVHFSAPWVMASHVLLLGKGSAVPGPDYSGRLAHFSLPILRRMIGSEYPKARLVPLTSAPDILSEVCLGDAIGFLEKRAALIALKESPPNCEIRLLSLPRLNTPTCIASTFEAAGAADLLRREIGHIFREGALAQTIAKYSYYGLDDAWSTYDLLQESERGRFWAWATGASAVVLTLALAQILYLRQRRRSEKMLRQSEQRFRAIFQQAGVGVAQISLDGKIEIANDRYCEVVGHHRKDLVGKGTTEITHRDDLEEDGVLLSRLLAGDFPFFTREKRYTRQDGSTVWAAICRTVVRDAEGNPAGFISVVEDISERRQAESALRESEERFRNLADSAPVMIWMCGPDKRAIFYSKAWLEFTGRPLPEALEAGWMSYVHPDDLQRCIDAYTSAFESHRDFQFECRLRRADGEYRWVLSRGVARSVADDEFAGFIGCCIDTTELKQSYEQHLALQKLESVGVLASGVAHDFNNLLGSIAALAESAQGDLPTQSPALPDLHRIQRTALDGSRIASQLLTFTRQGSAPAEVVDLSALIAGMFDLLKVSISKSAALDLSLSPELPTLHANPSEIRQLVMNMVINASEALEDRPGSITVVTAPALHHGIPAARLEVSDTGSGMTADVRARIFDPYFTTRAVGRGLGLSAVRGIVRRLGGAIEVESAPGAGCRFIVFLPVGAGQLETDPPAGPPDGVPKEGPINVLFVEDEEALRGSVAKLLRRRNFCVIEAGDGGAALERFKDSNPFAVDIILLDVTLPGMRGVEVFDELRRVRADVKVVVSTAYSQETVLAEFGNRKFTAFIRKPYRTDELVNLLTRCVSG